MPSASFVGWINQMFASFAPRLSRSATRERRLRVIEQQSLGEGRLLLLVCCNDHEYLIGSTPHSVSLLVSLPQEMQS